MTFSITTLAQTAKNILLEIMGENLKVGRAKFSTLS
jgi:hypothetical protein